MLFTRNSLCKFLFSFAFIVVVLQAPNECRAAAAKNYFPLFPVIKDNVAFWEKIYSQYSVNTAVLHDKDDLSIIYEAIPLLDKKLPGASRLNRAYLKITKQKYATLLKGLAAGKTPSSAAEKRIYKFFHGTHSRQKLKQAADNIRSQTGLKERFIEGVVRSGAYITSMKKIFNSYGLPEDLAYLPHVESSFNIKAYSKFGAAGAWQFTRSTGKDYLQINYIIDERRDPLIATRAAAEYLKKNFNTLGTWPLALTAYNYGHAGMQRALQQEGTYEKIFKNYRQGYFKFASRNFYSEFLAARNVAKKLEKSPSLRLHLPAKSFHTRLRGYAHIDDLSNYYQLSLKTLQDYNPSLRSPVWQGEKYVPKNFQLRLPYSKKIIRLAATAPDTMFRKSQKRSNFYTVKRGDTAGAIASRHGTSLTSLSKANNLNKNSVVYIGQTLRIPAPTGRSKSRVLASSFAATSPSQPIPELKAGKKNMPAWEKIIPQQLPDNYNIGVSKMLMINGVPHGEVIVQPEESLGIYAEWLKTSKQRIQALNTLISGEDIHPGQKIIIPFQTVARQSFEDQRKEFHQETEEDFFSSYKITGFHKYQVAMGDTLWKICQKKFDLPLWLLKKYNANLSYNKLTSSQLLQIPIIEAL